MSENEKKVSSVENTKEKSSSSSEGAINHFLRKRRLDLNGLSSSVSSPLTCQFQFCGIRLKDNEALEWHYEGHLAQELEKLDKRSNIRVKKNPNDFPDHQTRNQVRKSAYEKIKFRRESRDALPISSRCQKSWHSQIRCPLCQECLVDDCDLQGHMEVCLIATNVDEVPDDNESSSEVESEINVEDSSGFEEYEWAGQRRIRATSLVEGGLRGAGFLTIKKGDENDFLDIENESLEDRFGPCQYTDQDVILPNAESQEEEEERNLLRRATLGEVSKENGDKTSHENNFETEEVETTADLSILSKEGLCSKITELRKKLDTIKRRTICNVCMDCYIHPLVSISCYHVHCETCWLKALGAKKLCPQCKVITRPEDLRRIFL